MNWIYAVITVFVLGLVVGLIIRSRQAQVQPGTFAFVKGEKDRHRWYVKEIHNRRALLVRYVGSETCRWVDVKQLTKPPL